MLLHTNRLNIYALSLDQLYMLLTSRNSLAHSMGWALHYLELSDKRFLHDFNSSLEKLIIPKVELHPDQYLWYTHWIIHHREDNKDIGGIGISGFPNSRGEVMIGYYVDKNYEGQGLATESVNGLISWMKKEPLLKTIIADTPIDYQASQKVLQKNGFTLEGTVNEGWKWTKVL